MISITRRVLSTQPEFDYLTATHYLLYPTNTPHETWLEGQCRIAKFAHHEGLTGRVAGGKKIYIYIPPFSRFVAIFIFRVEVDEVEEVQRAYIVKTFQVSYFQGDWGDMGKVDQDLPQQFCKKWR